MPFVSSGKVYLCKYCEKPAAKNFSGGRNRGYYKTCGSVRCLNHSYTDPVVIASKINKGSSNGRWINDRTLVKTRSRYENSEWKRKVFERDNYTCQLCFKHGGSLAAHHIKPYSLFPGLRWELTNGQTLCIECHKLTPSFGWKLVNQIKQGYPYSISK